MATQRYVTYEQALQIANAAHLKYLTSNDVSSAVSSGIATGVATAFEDITWSDLEGSSSGNEGGNE